MKVVEFMEKYQIYTLDIKKSESKYSNTDEIIEYLKGCIENHKVAKFITIFDHYSHTKSLDEHEMDENIIEAKDIIFCFGKELKKPEVLGFRPRSIGVCEYEDRFVISFLEAPNPVANDTMKEWVKGVSL